MCRQLRQVNARAYYANQILVGGIVARPDGRNDAAQQLLMSLELEEGVC